MEKQLNVKLAFNADTSKAKAQIQELYQSLNNVGISTAKLPITEDIQQAQVAAGQLKVAMNQAFNIETGKLDLLKFNQSIKTSGTNLVEIRNKLMQIGPVGQQAFLSLAQSIASAEIPARRTSTLLKSLGVSLKNAVKWQFSSSVLHGFLGSIQSAYGYAQDLNKSLNNIRIVTGLSADEMDRFAIKANKAAKELNASTLDYTNASLIYYQQGLNEQQVKERTDVTIKMANVTGTAAEKVSQQMTSVWNNFDDGSKSLEYYADVMTALGAATASSTDEISEGLNKFSSVAESVGLSYEYASAALATVTATTRQSADIVGNSFKTLFARIQGLNLGETLDDGTTLNKYSEALFKVGINIKDQSGQLKDMNTILDEMGNKWSTLNKDQQVSLAQTVGGVRQYTQLIALMDNWDYFQQNLGVATSAEGTLQKQADIYAESWEGAKKRVQAAAEAIYTDLLNDDFFIDMTNAIEKVLTLFDGFLDSIGGAKGLLFGLSSILLNTFNGAAAKGLENMVYNFKSFVGIAQKEAVITQNFSDFLAKATYQDAISFNNMNVASAKTTVMSEEQVLLQTIAQQREKMTEQQQQEVQVILEQTKLYGEQAIILAQKAEIMKQTHEDNKLELMDIAAANGAEKVQAAFAAIDDDITFAQTIDKQIQDVIDNFTQGKMAIEDYQKKLQELENVAKGKGLSKTANIIHGLASIQQGHFKDELENGNLRQRRYKVSGSAKQEVKTKVQTKFKGMGLDSTQADEYVKSQAKMVDATNKASTALEKHQQAVKNAQNAVKGFSGGTASMSQNIVQIASSISSLSFAITQISNLDNIWSDETLSGGQKLLQTITSITMAVPMVINGINGLKSAITGIGASYTLTSSAAMKLSAVSSAQLATLKAEEVARMTGLSTEKAALALKNATIMAKTKELVASKAKTDALKAEELATAASISQESAAIIISELESGATLEQAFAAAGLTTTLWGQVAAWLGLQGAMAGPLGMFLILTGVVVALGLAIWGITAAWKAYQASTPEGQLQALQEAANQATEAFNNAKSAYDNLMSDSDSYHSKQDALDELTQGTEEWNRALMEANSQVVDLINKYPELAQYMSTENGRMTISDEGWDALIAQQQSIVRLTGLQSTRLKAQSAQLEGRIASDDLYHDLTGPSAIPLLTGATIATASDPLIAGPLAAITEVAKSVEESNEKNFNEFARLAAANGLYANEDNKDALQALYEEVYGVKMLDSFYAKLENSAQSFYDLGASLQAAQGQLDAYTQSLVNNAVEIAGIANSNNVKALSNAVSDVDMNQIIKEVKRTTTKEQAKEQYAALMGYGYKNGKIYSSNDPAEMTKDNILDIDMKDIYTAIAENQAMNELAFSMSKLDTVLTSLESEAKKTEATEDDDQFAQLSRILSGDVKELRQSDIDAILDAGGVEQYLRNFGIEASDYNINTDAIAQSITQALEVERQAIDSNIMSQEKFNSLTSDLTANEANNFNKALTDLGNKYGENFAQAFGEVTGSMKENLYKGIQDDFIIGLSKIQDLTDANAIDDFCDSMLELEDISEKDAAAIEEFREEVKNVALAVKDIDLDKVAEEFNALKNVIEKSKNGNREYTKEEKEALDAIDFDTSKFIETLDGFVYVGETAELQSQASQHMLDTAQQAKENYLRASMAAQIAAQRAEAAANNQVSTAESSMTAVEQVKNIFASWGEALSNVWQNIVMKFQQALESVTQVFIDIYNKIVDFINGIGEVIDQTIESIANAFIKAINVIIGILNDLGLTDIDELDNVEVNVGPRLKRSEEIQAEAAQAAAGEAEHDYQVIAQTAAFNADGIEELNTMVADGLIPLDAYNNALDSILDKEIETEGFDADVIEKQAEAYEDLVEAQTEAGESAEELDKMGKRIAVSNARVQKGIDNLAEGWDEWSTALKKGNKLSEEYQTAITGIKDVTSDMLGIDLSNLSDGFAESAYEAGIFERIMQGDLTALDELRGMAAQDIITKAELDYSGVEGGKDAIDAMIQGLVNNPPTIGASLDSSEFASSLLNMLNQTDMTVSQMQALFDALGYEPVIDYIEIPAESASQSQLAQAVSVYDPISREWKDGTVESYGALGQGTMIRVPVINGSKTKYTGGSASGGYTPPKPSGGGGGGGSAPKHAEKKNDSDKERYHTLQNQLEDLQSEYDAISEAKDRAFGKDKLNNIDKEIQKTNELIDKQKEYIDAISADLPVDKAIMDAYYTDLIGGMIEYDERGNISNYDQIQDAMFEKYNQMADQYDEDSEEWQIFEKKYEQLEKYIEQYEETYDLLRDEEETYQELLRQRMDLQLEKIQYAIELKLNIAEDGLAVLGYQMSKIEDNAFKAAEAIGLFSKKAELLYDQMVADREGLNDILGQQLSQAEIIQFYNGDMSVLEGKTFTEDQIDAIKDYRDNLLDLNEEFDDIRENIEEQVMEVFDAWNEKLEQGIDKLDHYGNVLESYKNIIDIVGKDTLGLSDAFMATLNQSSIDNAINKVTATKKSYETMIDAQSQAEQALEEAKARNDEASIKMWEENLQSITEEAQSAREEMLSAWEDALNGIAEQFEATVERVVDIFNKEIYTLGGLEGLSEDFSRQQENADIMLDDYQKIYELSKLSRDINKSIDDTDSISGKQKLKKLLEQINKLQEDGVEMSQYDLEYMQKTYDLRMAEIELEEAQRAKNTVRLRKDNEGNWSYVYTQNMDAVDTAQQKYEDALYAMQDVSSNYIDEMSEKLISTSQEMEEALAAIRIQDYANIDDYYAEVQRVQKQYEDELAIQQKELQKAIDNNKILYDEDWTNYHNATGYKISDTENFATTFRDTLLGSLMGSEEDTANFTDIMSSAVNTLTQGLMQGAEVYYANLQDAMNAAGTSTEDFAKDFEEKIKEIEDKSEESTNKIKDLAKDMSSSLKDITDSVTTWQETYGEVMQQIINSNLDVINSFNDMLEALSIDKNSITVKYDILSDDTKKPEQYASGGYTGKWGNYGKLAILDEKELILNKDDTVNFLDALGIAKQIIDTIDLNALQASYGFGNLVPATINENNSQTIEQDVHITAEFPNAIDHNEIEQAFETLINKASQYANRK